MKKHISYLGRVPEIHTTVFVAKSADIIGNVIIKQNSSIWFQSVLRGDINTIVIGEGSNIQDHTVVHLSVATKTTIGNYVTVGHNCIVHGCTIGDNVLIGMGSTILDGVVINENSIVGANSLVTKDKVFEEGMLILGSPAKAIRKLTKEEIEGIHHSAQNYIQVAKIYNEANLD